MDCLSICLENPFQSPELMAETHTKTGHCLVCAARFVSWILRCTLKFDLHVLQRIDHVGLDGGCIYILEAN